MEVGGVGRGADEEPCRSVSSPTFSYYPVVCVCMGVGGEEGAGEARVRSTTVAVTDGDIKT